MIAKGATWFVESASRLAKHWGISELVIGLTIVAFGTSAPEFGVTIVAAVQGIGDVSVGNIVGSNIFNLGLILGSSAIVHELKTTEQMVRRDGAFLILGTILLSIFLWDLELSRLEGAFLFGLLIYYLYYLYRNNAGFDEEVPTGNFRRIDILLLFSGLVMVLAGAHYLVKSAINIAAFAGISEWVISTTVVAAGTSAPEFAISIVASVRGRFGISIGNLIGSDIFNIFGVLGTAGMLQHLTIDPAARSSVMLLVAMVALVLFFLRSNWAISRREGIVLVSFGVARWVFSFL